MSGFICLLVVFLWAAVCRAMDILVEPARMVGSEPYSIGFALEEFRYSCPAIPCRTEHPLKDNGYVIHIC
jgi:hypothetical protein